MSDKNIPVYRAVPVGDGMTAISLVDAPAIEEDFQFFSKPDTGLVRFSIENEEQRILNGPLIRVDYKILRMDADGKPYYLVFDKDTAKQMLSDFLRGGFQNNVNLMHTGVFPEGIEPIEFYIKDVERGVNPKGFDDIADGSVFASYHISNDAVWKSVKDGTFKGFSLEAYLSVEPTEMSKVKDWLDVILDVVLDK